MARARPSSLPPLVLLGPQRLAPHVAEIVGTLDLDPSQPLAVITAGWEEREGEDLELMAHLDRPAVNLGLWNRTERVFTEDPELFAALRSRHDSMRRLRRLYRRRLDHAAAALREVLFPVTVGPEDEFRVLEILDRGEDDLLAEVAAEALEDVRRLDASHLARVAALKARFDEQWRPSERPALARERELVHDTLAGCSAALVAGGHVAVLLNRLRLFGLDERFRTLPVVAWAAGAMALTERMVLFHDSPPQGSGLPEVFEPGLGVARGIVALPGAATRLRLEDPVRVTGLARRMAPALCLPLDTGESARRTATGWEAPRVLREDGTVDTLSDGDPS